MLFTILLWNSRHTTRTTSHLFTTLLIFTKNLSLNVKKKIILKKAQNPHQEWRRWHKMKINYSKFFRLILFSFQLSFLFSYSFVFIFIFFPNKKYFVSFFLNIIRSHNIHFYSFVNILEFRIKHCRSSKLKLCTINSEI